MNLHECMEDSQTARTLDQTNKCPIAVYLAKQNYDSLQPRRKFGALSPFRKLGSARAELSRRYAFFEGSLTLTFLPSSFLPYWLTAAAGGGGGERCEPSAACPIRCHRRSVLPIAHGVLLLPARRPPSSARRPPTAWRGVASSLLHAASSLSSRAALSLPCALRRTMPRGAKERRLFV